MSIGIISALHEELAMVLADMDQRRCVRAGGRDFWHGQLGGQEVVAVLSRIGKVSAASTATLLASRFEVGAMLFTGVAGGLAPVARRGDIVVARQFVQHDFDASPLFPRHEIPLYGKARFATDLGWSSRLEAAARRCADELPRLAASDHLSKHGLTSIQVHHGLILSGDRFIAQPTEVQGLLREHPDALVVEMEGCAVAQVCEDFGIPFAAVRVVSDRADSEAPSDFTSFVGDVGALYSSLIVRYALEGITKRMSGSIETG